VSPAAPAHPILNSNAGCDLAAPPPLAAFAWRFRLTRRLHAARFDPRPAIQTFQPGVLVSKLRDQPLLLGHPVQQLQHQRFQRRKR